MEFFFRSSVQVVELLHAFHLGYNAYIFLHFLKMLLLWIIGDIFTWCSCRTIQGKVNWLGNSIRWKIWFLFTNRIRPLPWIRENRFLLNTNRKAWQYSLVSKKKALRKEMDLSRLIRWEALWTESLEFLYQLKGDGSGRKEDDLDFPITSLKLWVRLIFQRLKK